MIGYNDFVKLGCTLETMMVKKTRKSAVAKKQPKISEYCERSLDCARWDQGHCPLQNNQALHNCSSAVPETVAQRKPRKRTA